MENNQEFQIFELSNGLKVVHKEVNRPVAHCGLMINAGTRDELADEHGIAHFIEHAIFKGTIKRRAYHILNRLDSVGGDLDAYTTKEQTCIYASFLSEYYERTIELLSDLVQHSQFPEKELEKEKEVVLDEIKVYQDSPSDQIYDDFESQVFENHALGNAILGSPESVNALTREKIMAFMKRMYTIENMVFTSVGKISSKRLKQKLEKHFADLSNSESTNIRQPFQLNSPKIIHEKKGSFQTHCMMGKATYGAKNPHRIGMSLLNNILGGPAMNSILNLKVREKYGFTYNIESNYAIYSDVGLFSIYLGTDPKYIERCQTAIFKELKDLRNKPLTSNKLHLAKQQLIGQMALGRESNSNLMLSFGKSLLTKGSVRSMEEIQQAVDLLSAKELQDIAQEEFHPENFDLLFYDGKS